MKPCPICSLPDGFHSDKTHNALRAVPADKLIPRKDGPDPRLPEGLCGNREPHARHIHDSASLGRFVCHADQSQRLPYAAEMRRKKEIQN